MKHEHMWVAVAAVSAVAGVFGGLATAAMAQQRPTQTIVGQREADGIRIVRVSYRDLNLATAGDGRILHRRVRAAARDVCSRSQASFFHDIDFVPCVAGAWTNARPQMALATRRAQEMALHGTSSIPLVAIAVVSTR